MAELTHLVVAMFLAGLPIEFKMSPAGNRQRSHHGGHHERRTHCASVRISLRIAGRSVKHICSTLDRGETWFRKWWHRYLEAGPAGLYDLTRANHHVAQRIPPELERAILSIRRRLQAHTTPATRYCLIGATVIRAELKALGIHPLPCERTDPACPATHRFDRASGPPRPAAATPGVPRPASSGLQRTPSG